MTRMTLKKWYKKQFGIIKEKGKSSHLNKKDSEDLFASDKSRIDKKSAEKHRL